MTTMGAALLAGASLLAGCAAGGTVEEPPKVSLVHLQPENLQLFEQRYRVTLRILNPNDAGLSVRGMSYEIHLNGKLFGQGVSSEGFTVPAYGDETVSLVVVSNLMRVLEQFRELQDQETITFRYGIKGKINVEGVLGKVPFDHEGEIDLGAPPPARAGTSAQGY